MKIPEISISRTHAMLKIVKDEVYLSDMGSKFGTLIYVKRPIRVTPYKELSIQSGRTVMTFSLASNMCFCCEQ